MAMTLEQKLDPACRLFQHDFMGGRSVYAAGLYFIQGEREACDGHIDAFWEAATPISRQMTLWDLPENEACDALKRICASSVWIFAYRKAEPVAMCWLCPTSAGACQAAGLHIMFPVMAHEAQMRAADFLLKDSRSFACRFRSLIALIPASFSITARLLSACGFLYAAKLQGACHIARKGLAEDGKVYVRNRR